jgi:hypothetical protein
MVERTQGCFFKNSQYSFLSETREAFHFNLQGKCEYPFQAMILGSVRVMLCYHIGLLRLKVNDDNWFMYNKMFNHPFWLAL